MLCEMDVSSAVQSGKDITDLQLLDIGIIIAATDNFSAANKLGEGGFGPVYKVMHVSLKITKCKQG